jgi:hypothetical protein
MGVAEIVAFAGVALTGVGLYLTHSLRRQQSLKVAAQRVEAYRPLWELLKVVRRSRLEDGTGALTRDEARKLYDDLSAWYYGSGNGMFFTRTTAGLYAEVRKRLIDYVVGGGKYDLGESDRERAERCMKYFSLFRQQLRFDLEIISGRTSYYKELNEGEKELLKGAGVRRPELWGLPWHRRLLRRRMWQRRPIGRRPTLQHPVPDA